MDLQVQRNISLFRPFTDLRAFDYAHTLKFYTNASKTIGFGAVSGDRWMYGKRDPEFIAHQELSIEFLELYALCAGIFTWESLLSNCRITIFCDNTAVVTMVNNLTSSCKNCMVLIRMLTLNGLKFNRRIRTKYVPTKDNFLADSLSQGQMSRFRALGPHMNSNPDIMHSDLWPIEKLWIA